jgi:hypothetical protein
VLPTLKGEMSSPQAAGYDMSESFLTSMREFVLAQAQECFWQQAVLRELFSVLIQLTPRGLVQERAHRQAVDEGVRVLPVVAQGRQRLGLPVRFQLPSSELDNFHEADTRTGPTMSSSRPTTSRPPRSTASARTTTTRASTARRLRACAWPRG